MLYLTVDLRSGHATACFERNQLMPGSINLSLLYAGHANDLHINTVCGPPRAFRRASTCPRIDRWASGLILQTPRTFNTPSHARRLRTCWFPSGSPFGLTFACRINSLARSSKRTLRHRQPRPYYRLATGSFTWKILSRRNSPSPISFRHFSPPLRGYFSAFAHATNALSVSSSI